MIQLKTAVGCMEMIASYGRDGLLAEIGVTESDYNKLSGPKPWMAGDRVRVANTLNALMCCSVDGMMLPRFQLSAEYIAAAICVFVHPTNIKAACRIMENTPTASALGRQADEQEIVYAKELGGLCDQLYRMEDCSYARHQFEKRVGKKIEEMMKKGGDQYGKVQQKK